MESDLKLVIDAIPLPDSDAAEWARRRQATLTKPPGSLGVLEELSVRLAGMTAHAPLDLSHKRIIVAAADHGVVDEGVSAFPKDVTAQMVRNFLSGGAAINVLGRFGGIDITVVDAGVAADTSVASETDFVVHKIGRGTGNIRREPAMTRKQAYESMELGIHVASDRIEQGAQLLGAGEMGIGNTSSATAIASVLTGRPVEEIVGRGTGIPESRLAHKIEVIRDAVQLHSASCKDGIDVLARLGGFEIGCLTGVILAAASRRVPIVIDGFISTSAALLAAEIAPRTTAFMIAGHQSAESGHAVMLRKLGLAPILSLGMRLGEGTGAALAMHVVEAACRLLAQMATFDGAGVSSEDNR
ncbi:MAG TPA: nicotinate-nucleotide--dimethylbenzimidazole phosphoribosyltransferase [Spirochaetia bacterium]|nr:nicotinate-nucleotide--dimethylbenzimidazole phosphoribosyltransferase [Spirochaetia bacterium]